MRTILVHDTPVPAQLRELVTRGSTTLEERPAAETGGGAALDADRIVFWSARVDDVMRAVVRRYATAEAAARREILVFVSAEDDPQTAAALSPNEVYVWPRDEDRLKMAFLTGA